MIGEKSEILVIEDDPGDIEAIKKMLMSNGGSNFFDISGSTALSDGLEMLEHNHFDAILLDLGLPDSKGLDTLRMIHHEAPKVPIIVLTGLQDEDLGVSALGDGAQDYLVKGKMDGDLLVRAIRHAIERRLVEETLILKDRAIESSIECIGFADMCGNIAYANQSFIKSLGYGGTAEMIGKNMFDMISDKAASAVILKSLLENSSWTGEERGTKKDGSEIDIQLSATLVKNDIGQPLCIMASWIDITEKKIAEKELRIRDTAIASSLNAIAIADLSGNLISVNKAFLDVLGFRDEKEVVGKSVYSLYPDSSAVADLTHGLLIEERWTGEFPAKKVSEGSRIWIRGMINLVRDGTKNPLCYIGSFMDITEQKRAEERLVRSEKKYRQLFEFANEGIWVVDGNDVTNMVNPKMAEMLGYSTEEMIGKPIFCFVPDSSLAAVKRHINLPKKGMKNQYEQPMLRKDGSCIQVTVSASPIVDENGGYIGTLAFVGDLTERKENEVKLKNSMKEAQEAKARAQMYFDFLGHDIANIVSPILIYSDMLCDAESLPSKARELIGEIASQAHRASSLIMNLRRLEEIESMSPEDIEMVDMRIALEHAEAAICRAFPKKKFAFSHAFAKDEDVKAKASGILEDLLAKIFDNAARYAEDGNVTIEIRVSPSRDLSGVKNWQLEIADYGPGIPQQKKNDLMAPTDPTKRLMRGIYSSLSFCASIVRHIGGDMWIIDRVPNDPAKGTKIIIRLPGGE